jgi:hypothetical protein
MSNCGWFPRNRPICLLGGGPTCCCAGSVAILVLYARHRLGMSETGYGYLFGGAFGHPFGITAPFWIAAAVMVVATAIAWRPLRRSS